MLSLSPSYPGYDDRIWEESSKPTVGWKITDQDLAFVDPNEYAAPNIIYHKNAAPANQAATVEAGGTIEFQWTPWPSNHHGPVVTYLANCNGPCGEADKTQLKFNLIDAVGLYEKSTTPYTPGRYATDQLIQNGNKWTVTIPSTVAKGNYVIRHEIIALHSAYAPNGAQNYPQCISLEIFGSGTDELPSGTPGVNLYTPDDPGILINIYQNLNYVIPGPSLYQVDQSNTPVTTTVASDSESLAYTSTTSYNSASTSASAEAFGYTSSETSTAPINLPSSFNTAPAGDTLYPDSTSGNGVSSSFTTAPVIETPFPNAPSGVLSSFSAAPAASAPCPTAFINYSSSALSADSTYSASSPESTSEQSKTPCPKSPRAWAEQTATS